MIKKICMEKKYKMENGCDSWHIQLGQEELPEVRGQGQWPRVPGWDCAGMAERSHSGPRSGSGARSSHPVPEPRVRGWEEPPHS